MTDGPDPASFVRNYVLRSPVLTFTVPQFLGRVLMAMLDPAAIYSLHASAHDWDDFPHLLTAFYSA